jgi:hypothetical protein
VRGDDNDRVLFFIEENRLDTTWDLAHLRAVLEIVSEANSSRLSSKEEKRVGVILLLAIKSYIRISLLTLSS